MRTVSAALRAALFSDAVNWLVKLTIGAVTIDRSRILYYHVHEYGRLGRADLDVVIDNADGAYTSAAWLKPGQSFTSSEGAVVAGVDTYVQRATWLMDVPQWGSWRSYSDTIHIKARNNWLLLSTCPEVNTVLNSQTIGAIAAAVLALGGIASFTDDAAAFWDHTLDKFTIPAGLPLNVSMGILLGDGDAYARGFGHFSSDGSYTIESIIGDTTADDSIGDTGDARIYGATPYKVPVPTRIIVRGYSRNYSLHLTDLETLIGTRGYQRLNLLQLRGAAVEDRAEQEALELLHQHQRIGLQIDPHIGLELHDVVELYSVSGITSGSKWRVDDIDLKYEPSSLKMTIGARAVQTSVTYLPVIGFEVEGLTENTIRDDFDLFGGDVPLQGGNAGLYWLSLILAEGGAGESGTWVTFDGTHIAQGAAAYMPIVSAPIGETGHAIKTFTPNADFTQEGRFTDDDYLTFWTYSSAGLTFDVVIVFYDGAGVWGTYQVEVSDGQASFQFKRADVVEQPGFDWSDVDRIDIQFDTSFSANSFWLDDVRISKADPDDATTYNDTGPAWDFAGGTWHIYQDLSEVLYALGQIDTRATTRKTAIRAGEYCAANHFAAGVYLRDAGAGGLLAFAVDGDNGYEIKIDSAANTVVLLRWDDGSSTSLGSVTHTIDPLVRYRLGVMRRGGYLAVYLSDDDTAVFRDSNLVMYVEDDTYLSGRIGLVSYGVNSRFFHVRAGSPEHALSAEFAHDADTLDGYHASAFAAVAAGVTGGNAHDHNGGDGAQINHATLSNIGTNTHAQIDTHVASTSNPHSTSDANIVTTDVTTNNVSTSKHGFVPKAPNLLRQFLRGDGAWGMPYSLIDPFLSLPELRGFWPMSSVNESGNVLDLSGQARTLTNNGSAARAVYGDLVSYFDLNGSGQYLSRADEAGLDITGAITVLGWFRMDTASASAGLFGKWTDGTQAGYLLYYDNFFGNLRFALSSAGTGGSSVSVAGPTPSVGAWYFIAGRLTPSVRYSITVNGTVYSTTTSVPASIFNNTAALEIGAYNGAANYLNGQVGPCALCATDVSNTQCDFVFGRTRGAFGV
jgi:hypothetical protein